MREGGHRHRHADSGALIADHRTAALLHFTDGAADSQPLQGRSAAIQTDVDGRHLMGDRQFKADVHGPVYLIQREIKFQAGASGGGVGPFGAEQFYISAFPKHHLLRRGVDADGDIHNILGGDAAADPKHHMIQISIGDAILADAHNVIAEPLILAGRGREDGVG